MIELGWPDKRLSPNSRCHWSAKAAATKSARTEAFYATKAIIPSCFTHNGNNIRIITTFYPPDRRARDMDNAISSMKAHRDGVADALGVDDKHFSLSFQWGEPIKGGKVVVTIV